MTTPEELDALVARLLDGPQRVYRDLHAAKKAATAITALRARVAELEAATDQLQYIASANATRATPAPVVPAEGLDAHRYALHLATALRERLFPDNTGWRPFDTLLGLLTQIDNMTTAIAPPVVARVRPLVWEPCEAWKRCSKERAKAFGGEYQIVMLDPDDDPPLPSLYFEIGLGAFMFRFEQGPDPLGLPGETCPRTFPSVEAAKAAAQADYEARILAALLPAGEE